MSSPTDSCGDPDPIEARWFAGDRRLYFLNGPLDQESQDNPERLEAGHAVHLPRSVCVALGLDPDLSFTLAAVRGFAFGSMGFCEIDEQPGRGAWIRLRHLTRSDWHTRLERARPARQR